MSEAPPSTAPPTKPARHDRKAKRLVVSVPSRIRHKGMRSVNIVIRDLAFTGFRADCAETFVKGARIFVDLPPFGLVPARVAWARDGMVGGLFDAVVDIRHCVLRPDEQSYFSARRLRTSHSGDRSR